MLIRRRAQEIIDPQTEAHYSFRTMLPGTERDGRITTTHHDHDFYELFLVTDGTVIHLINGDEHMLQAGDLVFIRPADQHSYRQVENADCQLINLAFPTWTITALFTYLGEGFQPERFLEPTLPPMVHLQEGKRQAVMARLAEFHNIPHTEKNRIRTKLRLVLAELLGRHFAEDKQQNWGISRPWVRKLCQQMQEPANLRGGVTRMQDLAHTSPEHLSRTFRQEFACTPTEYVNDLRLTYAANLLLHSDRSIADISLEVGLENLSYFYRLFKRRFELPPAEFRARNSRKPLL